MAQDFKWKFFFDEKKDDIDELISYAEEEIIKEEMLDDLLSDKNPDNLENMLSISDPMNAEIAFFEDKGIVYGLSTNFLLKKSSNNKN